MIGRKRGGGGGGRLFFFTEKVRGQIIKSVRLLATSSNLKELINAASQACGSANQLSQPVFSHADAILRTTRKRQNERKKRKRDSEEEGGGGARRRVGGTDRMAD